jgi:hypothetical protein
MDCTQFFSHKDTYNILTHNTLWIFQIKRWLTNAGVDRCVAPSCKHDRAVAPAAQLGISNPVNIASYRHILYWEPKSLLVFPEIFQPAAVGWWSCCFANVIRSSEGGRVWGRGPDAHQIHEKLDIVEDRCHLLSGNAVSGVLTNVYNAGEGDPWAGSVVVNCCVAEKPSIFERPEMSVPLSGKCGISLKIILDTIILW